MSARGGPGAAPRPAGLRRAAPGELREPAPGLAPHGGGGSAAPGGGSRGRGFSRSPPGRCRAGDAARGRCEAVPGPGAAWRRRHGAGCPGASGWGLVVVRGGCSEHADGGH